ncbi:hypothetical protein VP01_311g3 [Puccinia sorghi]|uniref:TEA domain-containing protein n=1 Tax=Puccinia sorghi TaxID=27349 RepID=A0A0L6UZA0_9BASI|nr:hypothetical protein VP01_311g3 [Puccinia sorghi]
MTSYDFFAPCSTPKRQRTSSNNSERLVNLPIEGPSRRKTPACLDLSGSDFLPIFSGLPFDSPTTRQCSSRRGDPLTTNFPDFDMSTLIPPSLSFEENSRSCVESGGRSVTEGVLTPLQIAQGNIENVKIPFSLGPLEYPLKNVEQTPAVWAENLLCPEPFINRNQDYLLQDRWRDDNVPIINSESSSYSSLNSSSSDRKLRISLMLITCNPLGDFESSTDPFSSTPSFDLTQTHLENRERCTQVALKHPSATILMNSDLNLMDSGSNMGDNDFKRLFNVPMLSLHVTNNLREAQKMIEIIRCEATKRQLYSKDRDIWSEEASRAFDEAIRVVPRLGRAKILALTPDGRKPFGRNELIADYIYRRTGILRHRKQISSHIQVIKNSKKLDTFRNFYSSAELPDSAHLFQNVSFDQCSASWFGGYMSKDVRSLQHQAPVQTEKEYMAFLEEVAHARNSKPFA